MIRTMTVRQVAKGLRERLDPLRAVTLVGDRMTRALFAGQASKVLFWALVFANYDGRNLCDDVEQELTYFSAFIERAPSERN